MNAQTEPADIAILLPDLRPGGAERVNLLLAAAFASAGLSVEFVLCRKEGELLDDIPTGAGCVDLGAARLRDAVLPLAAYLRRRRPRALRAAMWPLTVIAALARRISGTDTRLVLSEHSTMSLTPQARGALRRAVMGLSMRYAYRAADGVVAVSSGVRDDLAALSGLPSDRFTVIHNPVSVPEHVVPDESLWPPRPTARIIAVGSLKPAKDYPTLLRSFAAVRGMRPAHLLILGEGPLRGEIERLVKELAIGDDVSLPGFVRDVAPPLAAADLFVLSSAWEGFGNVIVEALACGVPVVSTDCRSGPREILGDGRYGRLVPVGDHEALARAMLDALDSRHEPSLLTARAHDFSVDAAAGAYLRLLAPGTRATFGVRG